MGASIFKTMDGGRQRCIENLRHYVPDAELFKDHAGAARDGMTRSGLTLLTSCYLSQLRPSVGRCWRGVN
jgi:hypothetical protein